MKYFQLLLLFGTAYLAIVGAQEEPSDDEVAEDSDNDSDNEVNSDSGAACSCPRDYKPVCGSDGVTYANKCLYECENEQRKSDGRTEITVRCPGPCDQCTKPCICTKEYKPVCGSDGVTYGNKCMYECENEKRKSEGNTEITVRCQGPCNQCPKPCVCTREYKPVCGSDSVTYSNKCELDCENKNRARDGKPEITSFPGKCPSCPCPANYLPICGDDNVTYGNDCALKCLNNIRKKAGQKPIGVICERACEECQVECACPLNYLPVCGSDGVTYGNECAFNCEKDRRERQGEKPIVIQCKTACESCAVPASAQASARASA